MNKINKGDIVGRKSYGKDIIFTVRNILATKNGKIAILKGITKRIEADSDLEDLELISEDKIKNAIEEVENDIEMRIEKSKIGNKDENYTIGVLTKNNRSREKIVTG